jgi:hypothetical protein
MRFAAAARCSGEKFRFFRTVFAGVAVDSASAVTFDCAFFDPGGRPRLFPIGAPSASMARFSLSLSAMSSASI